MKKLPQNVKAYKKTPEFHEDNIPTGILNDHQTKKDIWARIVILEGKLEYVIQTEPKEVVLLTTDHYGVVEPEQLHHVKPLGPVRFYIEFLKD